MFKCFLTHIEQYLYCMCVKFTSKIAPNNHCPNHYFFKYNKEIEILKSISQG